MTKKDCIVGYPTLQVLFNMACSENVIQDTSPDDDMSAYQVGQNVVLSENFHLCKIE